MEKPFKGDLGALLADLHHYCGINNIDISAALQDGHLLYKHEIVDYSNDEGPFYE